MKSPGLIHRIKHFLEFFGKISEEQWTQGRLVRFENGKFTMCALGHLGVEQENQLNPEGQELCELLFPVAQQAGLVTTVETTIPYWTVTAINDTGKHNPHPLGNNPRTRILTALRQRLEMETENEITQHHSSDQTLP